MQHVFIQLLIGSLITRLGQEGPGVVVLSECVWREEGREEGVGEREKVREGKRSERRCIHKQEGR